MKIEDPWECGRSPGARSWPHSAAPAGGWNFSNHQVCIVAAVLVQRSAGFLVQRQRDDDSCSASGRRVNADPSPGVVRPLAHAEEAESRSFARVRFESFAGVRDVQADVLSGLGQAHRRGGGAAVPITFCSDSWVMRNRKRQIRRPRRLSAPRRNLTHRRTDATSAKPSTADARPTSSSLGG